MIGRKKNTSSHLKHETDAKKNFDIISEKNWKIFDRNF